MTTITFFPSSFERGVSRALDLDAINSWPHKKPLPFAEMSIVLENATYFERRAPVGIRHLAHGFHVGDDAEDGERYYCAIGRHRHYRDFAVMWSARGPGESAGERPCLLFCNGSDGALI